MKFLFVPGKNAVVMLLLHNAYFFISMLHPSKRVKLSSKINTVWKSFNLRKNFQTQSLSSISPTKNGCTRRYIYTDRRLVLLRRYWSLAHGPHCLPVSVQYQVKRNFSSSLNGSWNIILTPNTHNMLHHVRIMKLSSFKFSAQSKSLLPSQTAAMAFMKKFQIFLGSTLTSKLNTNAKWTNSVLSWKTIGH